MSVSLVTLLASVWATVSKRQTVINNQVRARGYRSALEAAAAAKFRASERDRNTHKHTHTHTHTHIHTHMHMHIIVDSERGLGIRD